MSKKQTTLEDIRHAAIAVAAADLRTTIRLHERSKDPRGPLVTDAEAADMLADAARVLLHALPPMPD